MPEYDFRSLSSYDFELLARDLLQRELGIRFESFSAGPDSGLDFRHQTDDEELILQCKHYVDSGFSTLASALRRKERPKIDALSPTRCILATSVSLTPDRKDAIRGIIGPSCLQPSDILCKEDLNNLLGRNPEIERQHFKLWLTSEVVLRRVLNAGIIADSEAHLDRIRLRLSRYVQNPSFERARSILDKFHYCIIAGIPGIGKTTLAEVLLTDFVDRQGFEAIRVAHDLSELKSVKNAKRRQVFYFDDFLGKTALENLRKNEDQRLIEMLEEAASNPKWRFVLTTREYILNSARLRYEALAHPSINFTPCVIKVDDYTRPIRGRILYNHLYFSDLRREHKLAILRNNAYARILTHRNYSPRIVEYMTQARHANEVAASLYVSEFVKSLENPARIWDHAFRHQISEASRHALLVLSTLPNETLIRDFEEGFWKFYKLRQKRFGFSTTSGDWSDALKQLDGNFIKTQAYGGDLIVSFHSPSVRDFLEGFLAHSEGDVTDLIEGAEFYEQLVSLWTGRAGQRYEGVDRHREEFLNRARNLIFGRSAAAIRSNINGEPFGFEHRSPSNEIRATFAVQIANDLRNRDGDALLHAVVTSLEKLWRGGHADRQDLVCLIDLLSKRGLATTNPLFAIAQNCLLTDVKHIEHFRALASFVAAYPGAIGAPRLQSVQKEFLDFAAAYSDGSDDDPEWLRLKADDLEFVGHRLDIDIGNFTTALNDRASELESELEEHEPDEGDREWSPSSSADDVDEMFQSLREDLARETN